MAWNRWAKSVGVALLTMAALLLAACGGSENNTGTTLNRSGTITIWHNWEGSYLDAKKAIFDAYTKQYPNVTINLVHKPNLTDAVTTAVPAGQGPDVIAWVDDVLGKFVKLDIIRPLDGLAGVDMAYMNANFSKAAVDADTFDGKIYGMPETVEAITMIYNKDLVSSDQVPKTTDALQSFAASFQSSHPGKYGVVWNTKDAYFNAPWVYGFGGYYVKADGTRCPVRHFGAFQIGHLCPKTSLPLKPQLRLGTRYSPAFHKQRGCLAPRFEPPDLQPP